VRKKLERLGRENKSNVHIARMMLALSVKNRGMKEHHAGIYRKLATDSTYVVQM